MCREMNMRHVRFVAAWQLSPSLEVAAAVLGQRARTITRQANRMRAAGVPLKVLTDQRFNRHAATKRTEPLTPVQQEFMATNYDFALGVARRACRSADIPAHLVEEFVEDAAVEALLLTARRATEPGFIPETAKGLLVTVVRRQVGGLRRSRLKPVRIGSGFEEWTPSERSPNPVQEAIRHEEEARTSHQEEVAKTLIGTFPDMSRKRESAETKELLALRHKARQMALRTEGTTTELRERLAAHYRNQLLSATGSDAAEVHPEQDVPPATMSVQPEVEKPSPVGVPEAIRRRFVIVGHEPEPETPQQQAEHFVRVWQTSTSVSGAARRLGWTTRRASAFARRLRQLGVTTIKVLPDSSAPLVRGIRSLVPSLN